MTTSTIDITQPEFQSSLSSAVVRANFTAAAADINALWAAIGVITGGLRVITAAGDVVMSSTDRVIVVRKTIPQATTTFLPTTPSTNQFCIILDGTGDADTYNITIDGNGNTINGSPTWVIGSPRGWNQLQWDGTQWDIVG